MPASCHLEETYREMGRHTEKLLKQIEDAPEGPISAVLRALPGLESF